MCQVGTGGGEAAMAASPPPVPTSFARSFCGPIALGTATSWRTKFGMTGGFLAPAHSAHAADVRRVLQKVAQNVSMST